MLDDTHLPLKTGSQHFKNRRQQSVQQASVLLVDDQPANLVALEAILSGLGHKLVSASSGKSALRHLLDQEFAVVLLDVQMHDLDGFETARLIRSRQTSRLTPIIFLTAYESSEFPVADAYSLGAVDYLVKPLVPEILRSKVDGLVNLFLARKSAENALCENVERTRSIVNHVVDGIITMDEDGAIESLNPAAERLFGYSTGELIGQNVSVLLASEGGAPGTLLPRLRRNGHTDTSGEYTGRRKSGSTFQMEFNTSEFQIGDRRYLTGIVHDLTVRKRLERQVNQAQKMEAIGRLAGGVAHDFNNLLTIIAGYTELLLQSLSSDHFARGPMEHIHKAGERAAGLTRQLLAFSRQQMIAPQVLDLNAVVAETEKMLRRLIGEDIELTTALAPNLGRVRADPGQIDQVLMNLAVNARDAMPRGGKLTIETRNIELDATYAQIHPDVRPGPYVMLAVSDNGCGMDEQTRAKIFEPFFTTKEPGKGTGLGLATVYGIVKQSGGSVEVYSEAGIGTTFKVYLPPTDFSAVRRQPTASLPASKGTETILLAEDEDTLRELMRDVLQSKGYTVLAAKDGQEALQVAEQYTGPIQALVSDVVMPRVSGRQLAERLTTVRPGVRVLYLSGYTDDAVVRHGVLDAETAFLQKPVSPNALARKVREVLDAPALAGKHG
jgi:two-component system cell cycle sensor histidine kinase/response regulator CckA